MVRFVSAEPLLGPVDLRCVASAHIASTLRMGVDALAPHAARVHWVIFGGESGPQRRPMSLGWLRAGVEQCRAAGVPVFVKQDSGPYPGNRGAIPDDLWVQEFPTPDTVL